MKLAHSTIELIIFDWYYSMSTQLKMITNC